MKSGKRPGHSPALSAANAALVSGVSVNTVLRHIQRDSLAAFYYRGRWQIAPVDFLAWTREQRARGFCTLYPDESVLDRLATFCPAAARQLERETFDGG